MKLPVDMFKHELLPYLTVRDIVNLDCAIMNHEYRDELMQKIGGMELIEDFLNISMGNIPPLLKWLGLRGIFISNMRMRLIHTYRMPKMLFNNNNKDQFKLNKDVKLLNIESNDFYNDFIKKLNEISKINSMIKEKKNIALFPLGFLDYDVYKRCAITITAGYEILTTQWSKFWIRGSTVRYNKLTLTTPKGGDQHLISNGILRRTVATYLELSKQYDWYLLKVQES